jgi:hypothetical protein
MAIESIIASHRHRLGKSHLVDAGVVEPLTVPAGAAVRIGGFRGL